MTSNTSSSDFLICNTCGTQFSSTTITSCKICDDPRQYVPPSGQTFTTLSTLLSTTPPYKNAIKPTIPSDTRFYNIRTYPQFAIGQRCIFIKTPQGNILWDCITFLDSETIQWIKDQGGLQAIVISHPHYYSTHVEWASTFNCPIYLASEDKTWLSRSHPHQKFITETSTEITINDQNTGVLALKLGGHFPGSLVVLAYGHLLIADTLVTTPSGKGDWSNGPHPTSRPEGMNTYSFLWSIPNMIPLNPDETVKMWGILKGYEFVSTHGAILGSDVYDGKNGAKTSVKERILESMKIQVRRMGWNEHVILKESLKGKK